MIRELKCPYGDDFEGGDECDRCEQYELCMETYPPVNLIEIPKGATNGDMIKAMFPNIETLRQGRIYPPPTTDNDIPIDGLIALDGEIKCSIQADLDWWNAPYKRGDEK